VRRRGNLRPASTTTRARRAPADETRRFIRRLILLSSTKSSSSSLSSLSSSLSLSRSFVRGWPPTSKTRKSHRIGKQSRKCRGKWKKSQKMFLPVVCYGVSMHHVRNSDFTRPRMQQNVIMCVVVFVWSGRKCSAPRLVTALICFSRNRTRPYRISAVVRLLFGNLWKSKCRTHTHM